MMVNISPASLWRQQDSSWNPSTPFKLLQLQAVAVNKNAWDYHTPSIDPFYRLSSMFKHIPEFKIMLICSSLHNLSCKPPPTPACCTEFFRLVEGITAEVYISSSHCSVTTILFIIGCLYKLPAKASPATNPCIAVWKMLVRGQAAWCMVWLDQSNC